MIQRNRTTLHCTNCGKYGHHSRTCKEPVTSMGIVCVKLSPGKTLKDIDSDTLNLSQFNSVNNRFLDQVNRFHDDISFLLIQRKHSLGFLEFVRGRYRVSDYKRIIHLFEMMVSKEVDVIRSQSFNDLWDSVWYRGSSNPSYEEEKKQSFSKYTILKDQHKEHNVLSLVFYTTNIRPKFADGEWGFPKGRRCFHEKNIDCAIREFEEETNYQSTDYRILYHSPPLKEVFQGTDGVTYRHVYYLALLTNEVKEASTVSPEVGDIGWFKYKEAQEMFRPYHTEKKKVLVDVLRFVVGKLSLSEEC